MSNNLYDNETLIRELTSNYMDKLFYFCLEKTGDRYEAENLASEIVINVLSSHKRCPATVNFSAWFWQIARNRSSMWAKKKNEHDRWISELDVSEYDIIDEDAITEDMILKKDDLELLRRELAFISSSYRELIVAYYIEDKPIKEIAASIGASESAVRVRLFRARKALKEGMEMARTFGPRSYHPGEVVISINGRNSRQLYAYIRKLLPQNILLEAYENPSTIEELAIALGIAMPYLEEEINVLNDKGFLKKIGDRYVTNFFIASKEDQYEIYSLQSRYIKELSADIDTIVSDLLPDIRNLGTVCKNHKNEDLKWLLLLYAVDVFLNLRTQNELIYGEDEYKIVSFEKTNIPEALMGYRQVKADGYGFFKFNAHTHGFENNTLNIFTGEVDLFASIVREKRTVSSLTSAEKRMWDLLINNVFAYEEEDGTIVPMIFTVTEESKDKIREMINSHPLAEKVSAVISDIIERSTQIFAKTCPQKFKADCKSYALSHMSRIYTMVINEEVESGRLTVPETPATSTACCYFLIKER